MAYTKPYKNEHGNHWGPLPYEKMDKDVKIIRNEHIYCQSIFFHLTLRVPFVHLPLQLNFLVAL